MVGIRRSIYRLNRSFTALGIGASLLWALYIAPTSSWAYGSVYNAFNVVFSEGNVQAGRSGESIFVERFESGDAWPEINNYQGLWI